MILIGEHAVLLGQESTSRVNHVDAWQVVLHGDLLRTDVLLDSDGVVGTSLVSEVVGTLGVDANPFNVLAQTFPAGTLSGAPKFKALEIIDGLEPTARGYYGGAIGFVGFNGDFNHAIMIRSFLSKDNTLYYQAGAGVVVSSNPESELQEVNNKLNALKKAVVLAAGI